MNKIKYYVAIAATVVVMLYPPLAWVGLIAVLVLISTLKRSVDEAWESLDAWHDDLYLREQAMTRGKSASRAEVRLLKTHLERIDEEEERQEWIL